MNESGTRFVGSDFVASSTELIGLLGKKFDAKIESYLFDMKRPDYSYEIGADGAAGIFTFGSLEQLAGDFEPMLDFLLEKRPKIVISIEPDVDTYDVTTLEDYLAHWFQSKRGYSAGIIRSLQEMESQGRVVIERAKRIGFGSLMMEGYNLVVWRPT